MSDPILIVGGGLAGLTAAHRLHRAGGAFEVRLTTASGSEETMRATHVLFALPPRLLAATVTFSPALDATTAERGRATPTWMAPHAKVFALYGKPFWREAGLSRLNFSMLTGVRPLIEPMPLEEAPDAIRRLRSGDVKFRMVLTMKGTQHAH